MYNYVVFVSTFIRISSCTQHGVVGSHTFLRPPTGRLKPLLSLSLAVPFSLSVFAPPFLRVFVCPYVSDSVCLCLPVSLSVSKSVSVSLLVSLSLSLSVCVCLSVSLPLYLSLSLFECLQYLSRTAVLPDRYFVRILVFIPVQ